MKPILVALIAMPLSGCAMWQQQAAAPTDTFCLTARKRTWDPDTDSIQTMREAVVWNRLVDLRCGVPGRGKA